MQTRGIFALFFGCLLIPVVAAGSEGKSCSQATELECIQSTQCTLVQTQVREKYTCRDSVGRCETGFRQSADHNIQKDCEAKPGCEFKAAKCYCPPDLLCFCGGGPPAQCVEGKKSE
jgi:hypothetical protein